MSDCFVIDRIRALDNDVTALMSFEAMLFSGFLLKKEVSSQYGRTRRTRSKGGKVGTQTRTGVQGV